MADLPISTFPIPASEADLNALADHLTGVSDGTRQVIGSIQGAMANVLIPIETDTNAIRTRMNRGIGATIRPINQGYQQVLNNLAQSVVGETSEIGVQANLVSGMFSPVMAAENVPSEWAIVYDLDGMQVAAVRITDTQGTTPAISLGWKNSRQYHSITNMTPVQIRQWIAANMPSLYADMQATKG